MATVKGRPVNMATQTVQLTTTSTSTQTDWNRTRHSNKDHEPCYQSVPLKCKLKPFLCIRCKQYFSHFDTYQSHKLQHTQTCKQYRPWNRKKIYTCASSIRFAPYPSPRHISSQLGSRLYTCTLCHVEYVNQQGLNTHLNNFHSIPYQSSQRVTQSKEPSLESDFVQCVTRSKEPSLQSDFVYESSFTNHSTHVAKGSGKETIPPHKPAAALHPSNVKLSKPSEQTQITQDKNNSFTKSFHYTYPQVDHPLAQQHLSNSFVKLSESELDQIDHQHESHPSDSFIKLSESDLKQIEEELEDNSNETLRATSWGVRRFKEWRIARNRDENFENLPEEELAQALRQFYAEARKKDGSKYSKNALGGLRSAINRHITSAPFHRHINILRDGSFNAANSMLRYLYKQRDLEGVEKVSYPAISDKDMSKLMSSNVFGMDTPTKLQNLVWFSVQLFLNRNQTRQNPHIDSFEFKIDSAGREYVQLKKEPGKSKLGKQNISQDKNKHKTRMYANGGPLCPVAALKLYFKKLNPGCTALYQRPNVTFYITGLWYHNIPIGLNKLGAMMSRISIEANLSHRYTNYSIKSTAIASSGDRFVPVSFNQQFGHDGSSQPKVMLLRCNDVRKSGDTKLGMAEIKSSTAPQQVAVKQQKQHHNHQQQKQTRKQLQQQHGHHQQQQQQHRHQQQQRQQGQQQQQQEHHQPIPILTPVPSSGTDPQQMPHIHPSFVPNQQQQQQLVVSVGTIPIAHTRSGSTLQPIPLMHPRTQPNGIQHFKTIYQYPQIN